MLAPHDSILQDEDREVSSSRMGIAEKIEEENSGRGQESKEQFNLDLVQDIPKFKNDHLNKNNN